MSFRVVRSSKFRHIYGQAAKREQGYDNIRITQSAWVTSFCAVNPKFLAVITDIAGGGAFLVLPIRQTGRVDPQHPLVCGHKAEVLDIAWCPFNDNVIASGSEDTTVKVWQFSDNGVVRAMTEPVVELKGHQKRVSSIVWHPSANNILLSSSLDLKIIVWDVGTGENLKEITCHPDVIFSFSFNWSGSQIVTTCKDKNIRIIDVHSGEVLQEGQGHAGGKPQLAVFMKNGQVFTTGFSKSSERQYALRHVEFLNKPITLEDLDVSNGALVPHVDLDLSLIYLAAKGDATFRYFEVNDQPPYVHYINTYLSSDPQRGLGVMPKRGCDTSMNEITRVFKVHAKGYIEIISMVVPRKSEMFQCDLYPDTPGDEAAMTADEWMEGKISEPLLISLHEGYAPVKKDKLKTVKKKANILGQSLNKKKQREEVDGDEEEASVVPQGPSTAEIMEEMKKLNEGLVLEVRKLKAALIRHEKKISRLEDFLDLKRPPPPQMSEGTPAQPEPEPAPAPVEEKPTPESQQTPPVATEESPQESEPQEV